MTDEKEYTSFMFSVENKEQSKQYKCTYCKKGFAQKRFLTQHIPIHTGERRHVCDICGASFVQKGNLTVHKRRHAGYRPFKCTICDYSAAKSSDVRRHMDRTHHMSDSYREEL